MATRSKDCGVKQQVRDLLNDLPDNCSVEDVQYQLYLIDKIRRGERSMHSGGGFPHEDVKRRVLSRKSAMS